jgi:hypothetical protein
MKDEPQQARVLLDAVGADWDLLGRYEHADDIRRIHGLPIIESPYLPKGTSLLVNPDFLAPHFEIGPISGPFLIENDIHFTWRPMYTLSMPHGWAMASIYDVHDDAVDALLFACESPKYRGLARIVHALRRLWRRFR